MKYLIIILIIFQNCSSPTVEFQNNNGIDDLLSEIVIPKGFKKYNENPPFFLYIYMDCTNDVDSMIFYKSKEMDSTYLFITYFKPSKIKSQKRSNESLKSNLTGKLLKDLGNKQDFLKVEVTDNFVYEEYYIINEDEIDYRLWISDRNRRVTVQLESLNKENNLTGVINARNELIKGN